MAITFKVQLLVIFACGIALALLSIFLQQPAGSTGFFSLAVPSKELPEFRLSEKQPCAFECCDSVPGYLNKGCDGGKCINKTCLFPESDSMESEPEAVEHTESLIWIVTDDGNPCTQDDCSGASCTRTPVADGTSCGVGVVCVNGKCVKKLF